ncbi:uncharacterized protein si:ch211-130h14.4 isoform X2 [Acipenser ruthenus]|uniref:uncharacterized protein si:ch211-130h14.4 isoform X2 n=1 Tax=Acipenser ruthenus TaxID=7906 RepID=UPI00145BF851|nr:uncharacterized protein si:ch211-130h14.4 isoform X2 [Acipenser ruthenus]
MTNSPELHRKSTLPSILNAYLPPGHKKLVQNENKIVSKKKHPVKQRNFNKKTSAAADDVDDEDDDDEEIKITKQAILDQRHLEAYKNMYRLRDAMHLHYRDLLREKVQKQRQQIRERSLELQKQTEKPRGQTVSGQKLAYSKLSHDDKYLQSIPKSSYYLVIDMQNQMAQCGLLKTRRDNEEFWHLVQQCQHTSQLKKKLKEIKSRMTKSAPNLHGQPDTVNPDQGEELLGENNALSEEAAFERSTHHQSKHKKEQDEIEQMFPKLQVPTFSTLQPGFKQYKTLGLKKLSAPVQKFSQREANLRKLHQMYNLSFANMASSRRLLDRNGQFTDFEEKCNVHNLIPYLFPNDNEIMGTLKESPAAEPSLPPLCGPFHPYPAESNSPTIDCFKQDISKGTALLYHSSIASKIFVENDVPPFQPAAPLTMEEVCQNNRVLKVKQASKFWINYTSMGSCDVKEKRANPLPDLVSEASANAVMSQNV